MDIKKIQNFVFSKWDNEIIPALIDYIKIPNKSPAFDPHWKANGYMDQAVSLIKTWCLKQQINDMSLEVIELEGRTPLIYIEIPGKINDTILLYGHLDKQPEMTGWDSDKDPWKPVLLQDKLYGRGGADDGYAAFASLTAIKALQEQNIPHARCVMIIEACEESGSYDLPFYMDKLGDRIGTPSLIIGLDSGCGNYEQFWSTTSLRGLVQGTLTVELLSEGVHSGQGSGIYASSFRILRQLLERLEDKNTGEIKLLSAQVEIPEERMLQAKYTAEKLGKTVYTQFPSLPNVQPVSTNITELLLNRTWQPQLCITGAAGLPALEDAGNVLRPKTAVKISLRIPPTCNAEKVANDLKTLFETEPPFHAKVNFEPEQAAYGWNAPPLANWLNKANEEASLTFYGKPAAYIGEGGSIPFMAMLGTRFPEAQFVITGVLGPHANAHGPNEFLHIPMAKKLTCCVAYIIAQQALTV